MRRKIIKFRKLKIEFFLSPDLGYERSRIAQIYFDDNYFDEMWFDPKSSFREIIREILRYHGVDVFINRQS